MNHNFDAAIDSLVYEESDSHITDYSHTVLFALKFTKTALSGEVSDEVQSTGKFVIDNVVSEKKHLYCFRDMCQQLAKDIG